MEKIIRLLSWILIIMCFSAMSFNAYALEDAPEAIESDSFIEDENELETEDNTIKSTEEDSSNEGESLNENPIDSEEGLGETSNSLKTVPTDDGANTEVEERQDYLGNHQSNEVEELGENVDNVTKEETDPLATETLDSGSCGDSLIWTLYEDGRIVISGVGEMMDFSFGEAPWYTDRSIISEIILETDVTSIGQYAFAYCQGIKRIEIPKNIKSIGQGAFFSCKEIGIVDYKGTNRYKNRISIAENNQALCDAMWTYGNAEVLDFGYTWQPKVYWTLYDDGWLDICADGTYINKNDFKSHQDEILEITVEEGVTSLYQSAFSLCDNVEYVELPDSLVSIGKSAFSNCKKLKTILIPDSVVSIGEGAFSSCTSLVSISIPNNVDSVEKQTFYYCTSLQSVVLGDSIKSIGISAFAYCDKLEKILLPSNLEIIEERSFSDCKNLKSIELPNSVSSLGNSVFFRCNALESVKLSNQIKSISWELFYMCESLTAIELPDSISRIEGHAFGSCRKLKSINLPDSIEYIGIQAFQSCSSLTEIILPKNLNCIEEKAFDSCYSLESIRIPQNVSTIGENAFYSCRNAKSIIIEDGVSSISTSAFSGCDSITSLTIPESITNIEEKAFQSCTSLKALTLPKSITTIGKYAFVSCPLEIINLPNSISHVGYGAFMSINTPCRINYSGTADEWKSTLIEAGNDRFINAEILYNQVYPIASGSWGKNIEWNRFSDGHLVLSGIGPMEEPLSGISFPWNLRKDEIRKVTVEDGISSIAPYAFSGATNITEVELPDSLTSLGDFAFSLCSSISSIKLGLETKTINEGVFIGCSSLERVIINANVSYIGKDAFAFCDKLTDAYYFRSDDEWNHIRIMEGNDTLLSAVRHSGLNYLEPEFRWNQTEDGYDVVVIAICEQYPFIQAFEGLSPERIEYEQPTCGKEGFVTYGAKVVLNGTLYEDTKSDVLPVIDHNYTVDHWEWEDDFSSARLVLICQNDSSHVRKISAKITTSTSESHTGDGRIYNDIWYNAVVSYGGEQFKDYKTVSKEQLFIDNHTSIAFPEVEYTGKPLMPTPIITLRGITLQLGQDFTVRYGNNTNSGEGIAYITGIGKYTGSKTVTFSILPKKTTPTITLSSAAYTYNGKTKKPSVTVKVGGKTLTTDDYSVKYASGRKNVGKYKVTVTLEGNYTGSKSVYFKINPKGTTLATSTAASKAITVKWKKQSTKMSTARISGYQIQVATDSKFTKNKKTVTVSGYSKTSKKVTGLKGKKKYYIRIRTYKTISGTKYYSPWSKAKTVTTKS